VRLALVLTTVLVLSGSAHADVFVPADPPPLTATMRLGAGPELPETLLREPSSRRVRLQLLVTDRAGNVERRSRTIRIRVIERPVRELKVALDHDFGMSTAAGNRAVAQLVNATIETAAAHRNSDDYALRRRYRRGLAAIRRAGHDEVRRDRVERKIYEVLELPLSRSGHEPGVVLG
jgi:hypothetical protein